MSFYVPRVFRGGHTAFWVVSAVAVLLLTTISAHAAPPGPPDGVPGQAFARADSVAEVARAARGLRLGGRLHLEGVALGRERVGLDLERFRVFAEDGELVVHGEDGDETHRFRDHAHFRGPVIGEPGSLAVVTVLEDGRVRGVVRREGGIWALAPGPERANGARALAGRRPAPEEAPDFLCGNEALAAPDALTAFQVEAEGLAARAAAADGPESLAAATTTPYTVKVAIETDWELWQDFGSHLAIEEYVGDLIAFASTMYDSEVDTNLVISHLSTWSSSSDPWAQTNPSCALYEFGRYWNDNRAGVERTIAHFVAGRGSLAGVAWVGVLCSGAFDVNHGGSCSGLSPNIDDYGGAYGYTGGIQGNFDASNPNKVWDIIAVTHEIGHNFNSPHTHCYNGVGGSSLPVDGCYNGQAGQGCYAGTATLPGPAGGGSGTIMSYCHFHSPGLSNIAFSFGTGHPYGVLPQRVPDRMRTHVESRAGAFPACFTREEPGGGGEPPCPDEIFLTSGTVNGTDLEETCGVIYAGGSYTVGGSGDLTLRAFRVVLQNGFSVASGGSLTVENP
jgi:hypothetical protein